MNNIFTFILACLCLPGVNKETDIQLIPNSNAAITIDAIPNEDCWKKAHQISTFMNPWNRKAEPETSVSLLWNGKDLYFQFTAKDKEVVLKEVFTEEHDVSREDRVEFFISPKLPLSDYYAIEMDPLGRVLDYKVGYYRKFDDSWNAGKHLRLKGRLTPDGYCVEGCLDDVLLKQLTNGQKSFYLGAYRAEFSKDKHGKLIYEWLCIKDPQLPKPDFHVEGTFVKVTLK